MAARKLSRSTVSAADVAVMFEEIRGQFRAFGEALQATNDKMDRGFAEVRGDIAELKSDVAVLKSDVAVLKSDNATFKGDIALLKLAVLDNSREIKELRRDVMTALDKKVDRDELERLLAARPR